jgi:hypothetical protein
MYIENEYTNLEMFVSRRKPNATESDLVWHISHLERLTAIKLLGSDGDTRSGGFYVTVFGWCTEDAQCSDQCSCAPCSNLENASYTLKVSGEMDYDYSRDSIDYLDPCTSDGTCSSTCSYSPSSFPSSSTSSNHRNHNKLSRSAIIGIVFACFGFLLLLALGVYLVRVQLSKQVGVMWCDVCYLCLLSPAYCMGRRDPYHIYHLSFYLVTQASCICIFL